MKITKYLLPSNNLWMRLSMLISPSAMFGVRQPSTPDFKAYISRPFFSQHLTDRKPKSWYSRNKAVSFKPCSSFPKSWPVHERQLCFTADSGPVLAQLPNLLNSCTQHSQCTVKCYSSSKLSELSSCCLALASTFIEFHALVFYWDKEQQSKVQNSNSKYRQMALTGFDT